MVIAIVLSQGSSALLFQISIILYGMSCFTIFSVNLVTREKPRVCCTCCFKRQGWRIAQGSYESVPVPLLKGKKRSSWAREGKGSQMRGKEEKSCLKEKEGKLDVDGDSLITRWVLSERGRNRRANWWRDAGPTWLSVMRYGRCDFIFRTQGPRTMGFIGFWVGWSF